MYNLHLLGWHSFQQLSLTILREILGQTVETFLDSNDGGRDGAFSGTWKIQKSESFKGKFVFQCKFTSKENYSLKSSDIKDELIKAERLVKNNNCDCYILITNAGVSATLNQKIESSFKNIGVKQFAIYSSTWIVQQIKESKRLRTLVPRVYGLGDLSEIIDERAYHQASTLLNTLKEDLAKVVITSTYQNAVEAVNKHGFVLLIGEPAAGKTTIASLLAMATLDQWSARTLKLDDSSKLVTHWNPNEPSQFFWIDDAFGVTQYESSLTQGWNHVLPQIKAMIQNGAKIVMTSRDYIYNRARKDLKEGSFPLFQESQVVIDVHNLSLNERSQILYNHLKLGKQSLEFKKGVKPYLDNIASRARFVPETARRLAEPFFTKNLFISDYSLGEFVDKKESYLEETIRGLDTDNKAALALIYMRNDLLNSPIQPLKSESNAIERLGSTIGKCIESLETMKGSFVQHFYSEGLSYWKFKHPTIGDSFANVLIQNPEMIEIFLQGSDIDKLIEQITCGDVGIKNAVIIPNNLFEFIVKRLKEFTQSKSYKTKWLSTWGAKQNLHRFLHTRCSKAFLELYISNNPDIFEVVSNPGLSLRFVSELDVALKFHELGLLPEEFRKKLVSTIITYTIAGDDFYVLESEELKSVFTDDENELLQSRIRTEVIPNIDAIKVKWQSEIDLNDSVENQMEPLLDALKIMKDKFSGDTEYINNEIISLNRWIEQNEPNKKEIHPRQKLETLKESLEFNGERSIFDDIDI
jgi:conflict system STAND superfamily ATPase/restriction endonuclease